MIRKNSSFGFIACLLWVYACLWSVPLLALPSSSPQSIDRIVAVVNNGVIVESELDEAMSKIKKQLIATNNATPSPDVLRKQVLEQLVNKRLQLQLADMVGLEVNEQTVDKTIESIAKKNHLTTAELYQELQKRGIDRDTYRKDIHDEYMIHQIQQQSIGSKITVSSQEVDDFMRSAAWLAHNNKEYHLEDILVILPDEPSTQDVVSARKKAEALLNTLRESGTNFHDAAIAESEGNKALQGGDLGWRKLPEIPSAFGNLILSGKEGDILGPIQTSNGFHLIHIAGIRHTEMNNKPKDQHAQIQQLIYERKYEEALQGWMTRIRGEAFINMHPEDAIASRSA